MAEDLIGEAQLEMHFYAPLVEAFEATFGARFVRLLKPSPQYETWVGFDQGWIRTSVSNHALFETLRKAIQSSAGEVEDLYLGYFLQFKRLEQIRSGSLRPPSLHLPYLRAGLSLKMNKQTRLSQHETLLRLSAIARTSVCYALPMILTTDDLYRKPDLEDVVFVDVRSAPAGWATGTRHFIAIQSVKECTPLWCSDPIDGRGHRGKEWLKADYGPLPMTSQQAAEFLEKVRKALLGYEYGRSYSWVDWKGQPWLPASLTLMQFRKARAA